ncbi:hypothetical protein D0T90_03380 [Neisseria animalis]|uniref:Uncharacterized protein n=1 Tax=Neisseria animalis TaxID=492 RepID=A0A5P3MQE8_NEIAN|nr:hypothetical protein D0T90_03380 [Neisseria animalis]ROW32805.1 hypothetical protein CGZ60_03000 [Neisseria animalis]
MPCRTMCTVCGFAALSHSYFIRLYNIVLYLIKNVVCIFRLLFELLELVRAVWSGNERPSANCIFGNVQTAFVYLKKVIRACGWLRQAMRAVLRWCPSRYRHR